MANPTLPPSLAAEFRALHDRISALERGERSVTYRERLPVNDASTARVQYAANGDRDVYSAALVNPKYPVLVARFHVQLFGSAVAKVFLRGSLGGVTRTTQTWTLNGKGATGWAFHTIEVAWLHGLPLDEWQDTETVSRTRRGNVEFHFQVTQDHIWFERNPDLSDNLMDVGFTAPQANALELWFRTFENRYDNLFREPEYVFLAPENAFPTASDEGTLLSGSRIDI
jgi:hypothetical protein